MHPGVAGAAVSGMAAAGDQRLRMNSGVSGGG
jgi:hypothetical protein